MKRLKQQLEAQQRQVSTWRRIDGFIRTTLAVCTLPLIPISFGALFKNSLGSLTMIGSRYFLTPRIVEQSNTVTAVGLTVALSLAVSACFDSNLPELEAFSLRKNLYSGIYLVSIYGAGSFIGYMLS